MIGTQLILWTIINFFFFCVACICLAVNHPKVQMMHRLSRERYFLLAFHKKYMLWIQLTSLFYSYLSLRTLVSMVLTNKFSNSVFIFLIYGFYGPGISWLLSASSAQLVFALRSAARRKGSTVCLFLYSVFFSKKMCILHC